MYVCTYVRTYLHMYICSYIHTYVQTTYVRMYVCVQVYSTVAGIISGYPLTSTSLFRRSYKLATVHGYIQHLRTYVRTYVRIHMNTVHTIVCVCTCGKDHLSLCTYIRTCIHRYEKVFLSV